MLELIGNLSTEDLVYMLNSLNIETGIDFDQIMGVSKWFSKELDGKLGKPHIVMKNEFAMNHSISYQA